MIDPRRFNGLRRCRNRYFFQVHQLILGRGRFEGVAIVVIFLVKRELMMNGQNMTLRIEAQRLVIVDYAKEFLLLIPRRDRQGNVY